MSQEASRRKRFGKTIICILRGYDLSHYSGYGIRHPLIPRDCAHLQKARGVPVLNTGNCFDFAPEEAILDDDGLECTSVRMTRVPGIGNAGPLHSRRPCLPRVAQGFAAAV
jgi:hypothetical protein